MLRILKPVIFLTLLSAAFPVAAREMSDYPVVKLQSLDKVTARTMTFEANVGSTVKFGPLYIKVQSCRKASPIDQPESASFLQIWEITPDDEAKWVFSGWMFASSPALSYMDHPIYDVWVLDCMAGKTGEAKPEAHQKALEGEGQISDDEVPAQPAIGADTLGAPAAETPAEENTPVDSEVPAAETPGQ